MWSWQGVHTISIMPLHRAPATQPVRGKPEFDLQQSDSTHEGVSTVPQSIEQQSFSVKEQIGNMFCFVVSVAMTQFCYCSVKAVIDKS